MTAEELHTLHINGYKHKIRSIFKTAAEEAARLGGKIDAIDPDRIFSFDDYPQTRDAVKALMQKLHNDITVVVHNGIDTEWELANRQTDAVVRKTLREAAKTSGVGKLFNRNEEAREAFKKRQNGGLNLSDRVWRYTSQFKDEIEMGLDIGIGDGLPAAKLARRLKQYLQAPDKLFRRVRNKHGHLKLSQRAAAYHPGKGVYRSSYKNALRLTATETNMAYRAADYERWQHLDFVVGFEVKMSSNHPEPDICDDLKGCYPKTFKFTGWHPFCRCHVEPILKTQSELETETQKILNGEETDAESANSVENVPANFSQWVKDNADRIEDATKRGTLPYFLKDNLAFTKKHPKPLTTLEKAKLRHEARTQAEIDSIKARAEERQRKHALIRKAAMNVYAVANDYGEVNFFRLKRYILEDNLTAMQNETKAVAKLIASIKKQEAALSDLIPDAHTWHKKFSMAELQDVHKAVESKLAQFASLSLEKQAEKLKFEIEWVEKNKKYSTWEVSQAAYKKKYEEILDAIDWQDIGNVLTEAKTFKTKSKPYIDLISQLENAISTKDKANAQNIITDIKLKRETLEKAAAAKAAKQHGKGVDSL